jgi:hypothetical protein
MPYPRSRINQRWASDAERNRVEFDHQHKKKEMRPMRVMKCDMFSRKIEEPRKRISGMKREKMEMETLSYRRFLYSRIQQHPNT